MDYDHHRVSQIHLDSEGVHHSYGTQEPAVSSDSPRQRHFRLPRKKHLKFLRQRYSADRNAIRFGYDQILELCAFVQRNLQSSLLLALPLIGKRIIVSRFSHLLTGHLVQTQEISPQQGT
jgi:hypothetical protein